MSTSNSSDKPFGMEFNLGSGVSVSGARKQSPNAPMKLLVIGDFSLKQASSNLSPDSSKVRRVDVDNFDELLEQLAPKFSIRHTPEHLSHLSFTDLEHFNPDHLYTSLPLFEELRELRRKLENPATFEEAAKQLNQASQQLRSQEAQNKDTQSDKDKAQQETAGDDDLIASMLASEDATPNISSNSVVSALIDQIVAPHIVPAANPLQSSFVDSVDQTIGDQMRSILHHSDFQALEARWLALRQLIIGAETDEDLQIFVLDASRQQLETEVNFADNAPDQTPLGQLVSAKTDTGDWSAIVTDLSFSTSDADLLLLGTLGRLACYFNAPLLANANPTFMGSNQSLFEQPQSSDWNRELPQGNDIWQRLRQSDIAPWIALVAPRFLVRLPYGKSTDPIYEFEFEEISEFNDHDSFLWGPGSFCCALKLAHSFTASGWSMNPDDNLDVTDLPAVTLLLDGDKAMKPCAEINLGESTASDMLQLGVMPMLSHSSRNYARIMRFQSIAKPPSALSGPWS